jgi:phage-related protein
MMAEKLRARFFQQTSGAEPVRAWLLDLREVDRRSIGFDIQTAELGWPIGMPLCRSMGAGWWEARTDRPDRTIARVLFCVGDGDMVLRHGFIKKSQKTPKGDLDLALKRMRGLS